MRACIEYLNGSLGPDCKHGMKAAVATGATVLGGYILFQASVNFSERRHLSALRLIKQAEKRKNKEDFQRFLSKHPMSETEIEEIVSIPFLELLGQLQEKKIDHRRVLLAYQYKAFAVDQKLNCVVEFLYPDLSEVNLDGPLAGMPVSIKDNLSIKGLDSCCGMSKLIHCPKEEDAVSVKLVKSLGGVPFVKTAVPQTMMSVISSNPIDGVVLNPYNLDRTPGGSSSGEAALIGAGGSMLGLGTDIGGSIRLPAAFCGIAGFKPTAGRLSPKGGIGFVKMNFIPSTWGPLARDVDGCVELMRLFYNSELHYQLDGRIPPMLFSEKDFEPRRLRIGFFVYDDFFRAVPAMERAVLEVKAFLEAKGHELVPWKPPGTGSDWLDFYLRGIAADQGEGLRRLCRNDTHDQAVKNALTIFNWTWLTRLLMILKESYLTSNSDRLKWYRISSGCASVYDSWVYYKEAEDFRNEVFAAWREEGLDAILCPSVGCPAYPARPSGGTTGSLTYQNIFNTLNCPAGTVPVTKVTPDDVTAMASYPEHSEWHRNVKKFQIGSEGLPVSVQCATLPYRDELCLRVMKDIETVVAERQ